MKKNDDKTMAEGYKQDGADEVSVQVHSKAINSISLANTDAIVQVNNESDDPKDLAVTVNKFGKHARVADKGELHLAGDGSAKNVMIDVAGNSEFDLASGAVESIAVAGTAALTLGVLNAAGDDPSTTLKSITNSGSGKLTMDVADTTALKTIDGSESSGGSGITNVHAVITDVKGGSGADHVSMMAHAASGVTVDLGAGDDRFRSGAGHTDSRIDGGEGTDTLHLTSSAGYTYTPEGGRPNSATIYSNFEVLDVGGSAEATYNTALLGVGSVVVSANTTGTGSVTLMNMADGMGITVDGKRDNTAVGAGGTTASIVHTMPEREPGSSYSGELAVHLTANGGERDTEEMTGGEATLTLQSDPEIQTLNVHSNANPGGTHASVSARIKPSAGNYHNKLEGTLFGARYEVLL
ncbi:MAG: hypothetical protein OXD38_10855, partial [Aestuariivita sp.]|nr:hypothetical protein [Aestuariivita sp.]